MHKYQAKGQILVIVLLLLSILSIFIVAVATTARRDVQEQTQNKQYEQYYSLTEQQVLQTIKAVQLAPITSAYITSHTCTQLANVVSCTAPNQAVQANSTDQVGITYTIEDRNIIDKLQIDKDSTFKINLYDTSTAPKGYAHTINMTWTGSQVGWIMSLDYQITGGGAPDKGTYKVLKDVYDGNSVYTGSQLTSPTNGSSFGTNIFRQLYIGGLPQPRANNVTFDIGAISISTPSCTGTVASCDVSVKSLRLKPVIRSSEQLTQLSLDPGTYTASFPVQVRQIIGTGTSVQQTANDQTPTAIVSLQIPLFPAPAEIFDYVLRSEGAVVKPT